MFTNNNLTDLTLYILDELTGLIVSGSMTIHFEDQIFLYEVTDTRESRYLVSVTAYNDE